MARLTDNLRVETTVGKQGIVVDVDVKNKAAGLLAVAHDNTMDGIGTPDDPLRVNTDVIATKEDLAKFAKFSIEVVDELPEVGQDNVIYFVPKDGAAPDVHDEYVWTNGAFELIGSTQVDLTGYVKFTDYGTWDKAGVIKATVTYGASIISTGYIVASTRTQSQYESAEGGMFIGKGTLENIKKDLVERAVSEDGAVLSGYVKNTDYASGDTAGVAKFVNTYRLTCSTNGYVSALTASLAQYNNDSNQIFIGKGTLENIKNDLVKRAVTTNDIVLTDEEKAAAQAWLGIDTLVGDISTALSAILGE